MRDCLSSPKKANMRSLPTSCGFEMHLTSWGWIKNTRKQSKLQNGPHSDSDSDGTSSQKGHIKSQHEATMRKKNFCAVWGKNFFGGQLWLKKIQGRRPTKNCRNPWSCPSMIPNITLPSCCSFIRHAPPPAEKLSLTSQAIFPARK